MEEKIVILTDTDINRQEKACKHLHKGLCEDERRLLRKRKQEKEIEGTRLRKELREKKRALRLNSIKKVFDKYEGNLARVGKELGISRERVRQLINEIGLKGSGKRKTDKELNKKINKFRKAVITGGNTEKAAEILKCSGAYVSNMRRLYFPEVKDTVLTRSRKWTDEQLLNLYEKFEGNISEVARHLGSYSSSLHRRYSKLNIVGKGRKFSGAGNKKPCKHDDETLKALYYEYKGNIRAVTMVLGYSGAYLYRRFKAIGLTGKGMHNKLVSP